MLSSPFLSRGARQALAECHSQCKRSITNTSSNTESSCAHCTALFRELENAHVGRAIAEAGRDFYIRGVSTIARHSPHDRDSSGGADENVSLAKVLTTLNASAAGLPLAWRQEGVLRNAAASAARRALISMTVAEAHTLMQYLAGSSVTVGARKLEWHRPSQLHRFVPFAARAYLEWGSGGSTELVALLASCTTHTTHIDHATATHTSTSSPGFASLLHPDFHATSIESSRHFLSTLLKRSAYVSRAVQRGHLTVSHANIGATERLGFPAMSAWQELLRRGPGAYERVATRYVARFLQKGDRAGKPTAGHATVRQSPPSFDVVLVDGRWRVACALFVLPFIRRPRPRLGGGVLLFHDFGPPSPVARREGYQRALLPFYELHRLVHSLAVLRPRQNASADRVDAALKAALSSPA